METVQVPCLNLISCKTSLWAWQLFSGLISLKPTQTARTYINIAAYVGGQFKMSAQRRILILLAPRSNIANEK